MNVHAAPTPRPSADLYRSLRLAEGYAFARPAVHPEVTKLIAARLGIGRADDRARWGLDIGCGAGRSTAAMAALAKQAIGIDPSPAMLTHARAVAPRARFAVAGAEALPFSAGLFDLVSAAGSLNYTDIGAALAEIARVLSPAGALVIYDYSSGRRFRATRATRGTRDARATRATGSVGAASDASPAAADALDGWFAAFERRYPFPPGYALNVDALDYAAAGLRLAAHQRFQIGLPIGCDAYLRYVLSETNVELAVTRGASPADIRDWCRASLEPVFERGPAGLRGPREPREILFDGYFAVVKPIGAEAGH